MQVDANGATGGQQWTALAQLEPLPPATASYLLRASKSVDTLVEMIRSLLDVSQLEAGRMPLERSEVDLGALARSATGYAPGQAPTRCAVGK